ncbi:MAG: protein kinase [Verrucomicrobiota bacterium]
MQEISRASANKPAGWKSIKKPVAGAEIDGYRLVRPIGQGGFGAVWLAWNETSQSFHALKWVDGDAAGLKLELDALQKFCEASKRLRSPNLIAIEHINLLPSGLIYTLPLADGMEGNDPSAESWRPMTLADRIVRQPAPWFSSAEILQIIIPIIRATASLNDEGLVHRNIKPANILFFGGAPCLADMGLLANDSDSLARLGAPRFLPPLWYLESSGQPDMWGLATTLYTLLTGNNPDKMGRPKFLWPPAGKDSLSPAEQQEWQRLHAAISRATHEKPAERFRDFKTLAAAVEGTSEPERRKKRKFLGFVVAGLIAASVFAWFFHGTMGPQETAGIAEPTLTSQASLLQSAPREKKAELFRYFKTFAAAEDGAVELGHREKLKFIGFVMVGLGAASVITYFYYGKMGL